MTTEELTGEARVLALAGRMRAVGGGAPHRLYHECTEAFKRGEIAFDQVTPLYRHAMIHAGMIVRKSTGQAFLECPECEAEL